MADKQIEPETSITQEEKADQLNSIFKRTIQNHDLLEQSKLTKRSIELIPHVSLTSNAEILVERGEDQVDNYKLDKETGKIANGQGQDLSEIYDLLNVNDVREKIDSLTLPTKKV